MIVPYTVYRREGPELLGPGDAVVIKVCAVRGRDGDWAAYLGLAAWRDEHVITNGDKLSEAAAAAIFPGFAQAGLVYRP